MQGTQTQCRPNAGQALRRYGSIVAVALICTGCVGLGARQSSVTLPSGQRYLIHCQSDGVVDFVQGDVKIKVDNRGPLGQVWAAATASLGKVYDKIKDEPVTEVKK